MACFVRSQPRSSGRMVCSRNITACVLSGEKGFRIIDGACRSTITVMDGAMEHLWHPSSFPLSAQYLSVVCSDSNRATSHLLFQLARPFVLLFFILRPWLILQCSRPDPSQPPANSISSLSTHQIMWQSNCYALAQVRARVQARV